MNTKNVIIIGLIVILIAVVISAVLVTHGAETTLTSPSSNMLYNGDNYTVILTDNNGNPVANKEISVDVVNANGEHNVQNLITDANGIATFNLGGLAVGTYSFVSSFAGDFDYKSCEFTQSITIDAQSQSSSSSVSDSGAFYSAQDGRIIYTGEVQLGADDHHWKHMGNNQWVRID